MEQRLKTAYRIPQHPVLCQQHFNNHFSRIFPELNCGFSGIIYCVFVCWLVWYQAAPSTVGLGLNQNMDRKGQCTAHAHTRSRYRV